MNPPLNREGRRRYTKSKGRRVWAFSELNQDLRPEQLARILVTSGLEQARKEAEARADLERRSAERTNELDADEEELGHA